jgi:hypothetical protein
MALAILVWSTISSWGLTLANAGHHLPVLGDEVPVGTVAVAVRVTDPTVAATLEHVIVQRQLPVALFVDTAAARGLVAPAHLTIGVAEDPDGARLSLPWRRWRDAQATAATVQRATGDRPRYFLGALGKPDLWDLVEAPRSAQVVMPAHGTGQLPHPGVVIVDAADDSPEEAVQRLEQQLATSCREGQQCVPLASLS